MEPRHWLLYLIIKELDIPFYLDVICKTIKDLQDREILDLGYTWRRTINPTGWRTNILGGWYCQELEDDIEIVYYGREYTDPQNRSLISSVAKKLREYRDNVLLG